MNAYIDSFATDCTYNYDIFDDWDLFSFNEVYHDFMIDSLGNTWDSKAFVAYNDGPVPYDPSPFYFTPGSAPIQFMTFKAHIRDNLTPDDIVINDAIGTGLTLSSAPAYIAD